MKKRVRYVCRSTGIIVRRTGTKHRPFRAKRLHLFRPFLCGYFILRSISPRRSPTLVFRSRYTSKHPNERRPHRKLYGHDLTSHSVVIWDWHLLLSFAKAHNTLVHKASPKIVGEFYQMSDPNLGHFEQRYSDLVALLQHSSNAIRRVAMKS